LITAVDTTIVVLALPEIAILTASHSILSGDLP
jgi:hypothetical protein